MTNLADLRRDFSSNGLDETDVSANPFDQFAIWMDAALNADIIDANAMTVSTVGADGRPSARVVLLKSFDAESFTFFTNYGHLWYYIAWAALLLTIYFGDSRQEGLRAMRKVAAIRIL